MFTDMNSLENTLLMPSFRDILILGLTDNSSTSFVDSGISLILQLINLVLLSKIVMNLRETLPVEGFIAN